MKAWRAAAGILVLLAGCGEADPTRSRLAMGQEVLVKSDQSRPGYSTEIIARRMPDDWPVPLAVGTKVRVVEDADGPEENNGRRVRVNALDGEHKGDVLLIERECLRPVPQ